MVILLKESYTGTDQESRCNAVTMSTLQAATVSPPLLSTCCMYYCTTAFIHNHSGFLDTHRNCHSMDLAPSVTQMVMGPLVLLQLSNAVMLGF